MVSYFSQVFWGLLIVVVDVSVNGFDLIADGIGYLIIAGGCNCLTPLSNKFKLARAICFALAFLWLIGFAIHDDFNVTHRMVMTILDCAMIWQLLSGIEEFALSRQRQDLAKRAVNRRIAYVAYMAMTTAIGFSLQGSRIGLGLVLLVVISMVVLMGMILHLIHRVKVDLAK